MRRRDRIVDNGYADVGLADLDDAGDRSNRSSRTGADAAIERGAAEIDAGLRAVRDGAVLLRELAAVGGPHQGSERIVQRTDIDAVSGYRDIARNRDGARADIGQDGRADLGDDDSACQSVLGVTARSAAGGDHTGIVAQHCQ